MPTAYLLDQIPVRQTDDNGDPVPGARLYTYEAGTSTPLATYTDASGTTPLTNPIVADGDGFWPAIWTLPQAYKLVAQEIDATPLWQRDNVIAPLGAIGGSLGSDRIGFKQSGPNAVDRTQQDKDRETYSVEDDGAVGDGVTDSTAAINSAALEAAAQGRPLVFAPGLTYLFSAITFPANLTVHAAGSTLRSDGSLTGSAVSVTIGDGFRADALYITTPGTETNSDVVAMGVDIQIGTLSIVSSTQRGGGGGVLCTGQNVCIGTFITRKVERPLFFYNQSTTTPTTGSYIGLIDVEDYVRGFRADFCEFVIGRIWMRGRSPSASKTNGHNGVLISGCANWEIGPWRIEDSGEHAFRIGGSPGTYAKTVDFKIGGGWVYRSGGCALKINPGLEISPGVPELVERGEIGYVVGVDIGDSVLGGNEELFRLTHCRSIRMAGGVSMVKDAAVSAQVGLLLNDVRGLYVGEIGGTIQANMLSIDDDSDALPDDVLDVYIGRLFGSVANSPISVSTLKNVGRIRIADMSISGFSANLVTWGAGSLVDRFDVCGRVYDSAPAPAVSGSPGPLLALDVWYADGRVIGRADKARDETLGLQVVSDSLDVGDQAPNGVFLNNTNGTAGQGNLGAGLIFSRVGSGRRGAAVAPMQFGPNQENVGIAFIRGGSTTGSDALAAPTVGVSHSGALVLAEIAAPPTLTGWGSVFIDEADGDIKVRFSNGTLKVIQTN